MIELLNLRDLPGNVPFRTYIDATKEQLKAYETVYHYVSEGGKKFTDYYYCEVKSETNKPTTRSE